MCILKLTVKTCRDRSCILEATIARVLPLPVEVRGVESYDRGANGSSFCRPVNLFTAFLGSALVGFSLLNSLPLGGLASVGNDAVKHATYCVS